MFCGKAPHKATKDTKKNFVIFVPLWERQIRFN